MARRLALGVTAEYEAVAHAMRRGREARVGGKDFGSIEADEEEMGGGLGRVQEVEGARSA